MSRRRAARTALRSSGLSETTRPPVASSSPPPAPAATLPPLLEPLALVLAGPVETDLGGRPRGRFGAAPPLPLTLPAPPLPLLRATLAGGSASTACTSTAPPVLLPSRGRLTARSRGPVAPPSPPAMAAAAAAVGALRRTPRPAAGASASSLCPASAGDGRRGERRAGVKAVGEGRKRADESTGTSLPEPFARVHGRAQRAPFMALEALACKEAMVRCEHRPRARAQTRLFSVSECALAALRPPLPMALLPSHAHARTHSSVSTVRGSPRDPKARLPRHHASRHHAPWLAPLHHDPPEAHPSDTEAIAADASNEGHRHRAW